MGAKAEYVERLIEDLQASQRRFAEMTVSKWGQVDQLTLATELIPRFDSELRSAGLEPVYRVVSSNYMYGMPIPLRTRSVSVLSEEVEIIPGFYLSYADYDPKSRIPIDVQLAFNVSQEMLDRMEMEPEDEWEKQQVAEEMERAKRVPYWWPKDYPRDVRDYNNYEDPDGFLANGIVNPFEEGDLFGEALKIPRQGDFSQSWSEHSDVVDAYFQELQRRLQVARTTAR